MKLIKISYDIIKYIEYHLTNSKLVRDDCKLIYAETSGRVGS